MISPFDSAAPSYDADFTGHPLGRWLRGMVWEQLVEQIAPGDRVLELGCGTGEDAIWLAQHGIHVIATDASEKMLHVARSKAESAGIGKWIDFQIFDLGTPGAHQLSDEVSKIGFNAAFSNFGPLNCIPDRQQLAAFLAKRVQPGGRLIFVIMGPLCPWEIGWYLLRGQPRTAFRRFRAGIPAHVGDGEFIRVWYPSPARLKKEFALYFQHVKTVGIGTLLPPSYLSHLVDRWPGVFERLAHWDRRMGPIFPFNWLSDHYLMVFERLK